MTSPIRINIILATAFVQREKRQCGFIGTKYELAGASDGPASQCCFARRWRRRCCDGRSATLSAWRSRGPHHEGTRQKQRVRRPTRKKDFDIRAFTVDARKKDEVIALFDQVQATPAGQHSFGFALRA